jgi:hypothetical protein
VNAMVQLMGNDKAHGEVFHITSDTVLLSINNINHYKLNHILEEECFT